MLKFPFYAENSPFRKKVVVFLFNFSLEYQSERKGLSSNPRSKIQNIEITIGAKSGA